MDTKISKLVVTLSVIGIISAIALSFVYQWTTPFIEKHQLEARKQAVRSVLPEAEEFQEKIINGITFFEGFDSSQKRIGVAMIAKGPGYQNIIEVMIGVNLEKDYIFGIDVLSHEETPGLGARITGQQYRKNYQNKPFGDYNVVKRTPQNDLEVEAISGATISSRSVAKIVQDAVKKINEAYGGGV
ncbi:MAG: RnfABCDGE type electron transport complex subunit G [Halanaerobiales bacterium]|nr:RnfABCDGE type electron transport complex subunit G [Halanaerobiales bacterium]